MNVGSNKKGYQKHFDCYYPSATRAIDVRSALHVGEKIVAMNRMAIKICDAEMTGGGL